MANKILIAADTTPIVFADALTYSGDGGSKTTDFGLTSLASDAARQSDKVDLDTGGVENRIARRYAITPRIVIKALEVIVAGESVDFYWAPSLSVTAATANPGGVVGSDGAYSGTAGSTLAESLLQLQFIGSLIVTDDDHPVVLQQTFVVAFPTQYGTLVAHNNQTNGILGDPDKMSVTFTPIEEEAQ